MLTSDLLRARLHKGELRLGYLDCTDSALIAQADALIALFAEHLGHKRGALDDALSALLGENTDYLLHRGLAKLLEDRSEFGTESAVDPVALRKRVFESAAAVHPVARQHGDLVHTVTRAALLAQIAAEFALTSEQVERALYADLKREQQLLKFEPITATALLERYNLALAQAVLYRATALEIVIDEPDPQRLRQLFRYIKFFRLLAQCEKTVGGGYLLKLDGPTSLFQQSTKYGLQLAEFLPALLHCERWSLSAEVLWGEERKRALWRLEAGSGLRTHYADRGVYVTDEEAHFVKRFAELGKPWVLEKRPVVIELDGKAVLLPDLVAVHPDGREVLLEILGFWRRSYLEARLALLEKHAPPNLLLLVSERLRASEEKLESPSGMLLFFKDVIPAKQVLLRCEERGTKATVDPNKSLRRTRKRAE
jgi:predicted nuclease of restriction endonuclease-like RecB superfamily